MGYGSILSRSRKASSFYPTIRIVGVTGDKIPTIQKGKAVAISEAVGSNYIAKPWAFGEYEVKVDGVTIAKVNVTQLIEYNVAAPSNILNDCSWEVIKLIADQGVGANYWNVGDAKKIHIQGTIGSLSVNADYWTYILGFNHNAELEGEHLIHFGCFRTAQNYTTTNGIALVNNYSFIVEQNNANYFLINTAKTNVGGWENSHMRITICGVNRTASNTFYSVLPTELKNVMQFVTKYTDNVGGGAGNVEANVTATQELCPLLSEKEISNYSSQGNSYEGEKQQCYQYYLNGNSKIKYMHTNPSISSNYCYWWTRTPYGNSSEAWEAVEENTGDITGPAPNLSLGLAPLFCV